ncbi:unnamed protein product [Brachionus calyciflorus]|uniref:GH18 domain-containing protein n=1 Tax=Brachionus calyciflorus TaxID=104777 RepID=A0A813RQU7_9BILA|nr:unnamed protein product [Brachionus calyciflorus]
MKPILYFFPFILFIKFSKSSPMQELPPDYYDDDDDEASREGKFKTICYYTNWGSHREIKESRLYPEDIPADLCTHIIYAFGMISGGNIQHTIQNDIQEYQGQGPLFKRIMKLKEKNRRLKILISCGGWGQAGQFEGIVGSDEARKNFAQNVITFCRKWGFDGIDLVKFGLLAKAMREVFEEEAKKTNKPRLLSSIATAAGEFLLKTGYDVPTLCKYLDFVNVMTYDLYGGWYNKVGHHAALYGTPEETGQDAELNTNSSMYHWIDMGCSRKKLAIGIPTYGRAFAGEDPIKAWGQGGGGNGGLTSRYLGESGIQTYFEVCMKLNSEGYKRFWHPEHQSAIAFKKGTWIGFDDPDGARVKCEYVVKEGLNGAMFWTLDMDDFSGNFCKNGSFPVIKAVRDCFKKAMIKTTTTTTTTTTTRKTTIPNINKDNKYNPNNNTGQKLIISFKFLLLNISALLVRTIIFR